MRATGQDQLISELSGGNQQKVLLARALAPGGRVLVLNEPTRGVDIGAKAEIHGLINELAVPSDLAQTRLATTVAAGGRLLDESQDRWRVADPRRQ